MGNAALGEAPVKEVRLSVANKQALASLGLGEKETGVLIKYFQTLDGARSGHVAVEDFSEKVGVAGRFLERIFDVTDGAAGSSGLPFMEFAISLWNFCTLEVPELALALFQSYDRDHNGTLSVVELSELSKDLQPEGRQLGPKLRQALAKFDEIIENQEKMRYEHNMSRAKQRLQIASSGGGGGGGEAEEEEEPELDDPSEIRISPEFLMNFLRKNPALCQPLEQFHVLARQDVLGERAWASLRQA
jgi:Ca2+-binding EF-hand superfamily protein